MKEILGRILFRAARNDDTREELDSHIAMRAELNAEAGMTHEQALREAKRQFGNATSIRERLYDETRFGWLESLILECGYAVRSLVRDPGVSATAVLMVGISVGTATGMFSIMRDLMLAPPPHVNDPGTVFRLHRRLFDPEIEAMGEASTRTSYPFFELVADNTQSAESVAAYMGGEFPVGSGAEARMVHAALVSTGFWRTLDVDMLLGRSIEDREAHPATGSRVVVLGHAFWQTWYGGDPDVIGETLAVRGLPYQIVGVAPTGFRGVELTDVDLWLPMYARNDGSGTPARWHLSDTSYILKIILRLGEPSSAEAAAAEITSLSRAFYEEAYAVPFRGDESQLEPLRRSQVILDPVGGGEGDDLRLIPEARVSAWLVGVSGILVVVACANVAGLLLLRTLRRRREVAIRLALGVSRARLAGQLVIESLGLTLPGGIAALAVVVLGRDWLGPTLLPEMVQESSAISPGVLVLAASSAVLVGLLAGLAPMAYTKFELSPALRDGSDTGPTRRTGTQRLLLAMQVALSAVLLIGAGLFLRSLYNVESLDIGLDRENALAVSIDFTGTRRTDQEIGAFYERALERLSVLPGVSDASLATTIPLRGGRAGTVRLPGQEGSLTEPDGSVPWVNFVTPGFFESTGMRVVEGRGFVEADRTSNGSVIVVSEKLARLGWTDGSPIGECVYTYLNDTCSTVIGVVGDSLFYYLDQEPDLHFYLPLEFGQDDARTLLVRPSATGRLDNTIRATLLALDPALPYIRIETLGEALDPQIRPWRLGASLFTAFGILAVVLAMSGLWSSVSYAVTQRRKEFAIRLSVGARPGSVAALVLLDSLGLTAAAVLAGSVTAAIASPLLDDLLFGIGPRDPWVFGAVAGSVMVVAIVASLLPSLKASAIAPAEVLRGS